MFNQINIHGLKFTLLIKISAPLLFKRSITGNTASVEKDWIRFLLYNLTSVFQAMTQDIINIQKQHHWKHLLQQVVKDMDHSKTVQPFSVNLLGAVHYPRTSWDSINNNISRTANLLVWVEEKQMNYFGWSGNNKCNTME